MSAMASPQDDELPAPAIQPVGMLTPYYIHVDFEVAKSFPFARDYPTSPPSDNPQPASHDPMKRLPTKFVKMILSFVLPSKFHIGHDDPFTRGILFLNGDTNIRLLGSVSKTWREKMKYFLYQVMEWVFPNASVMSRLLAPLLHAGNRINHVEHPVLLVRHIRLLGCAKTQMLGAVSPLKHFDNLRRVHIDAKALADLFSDARIHRTKFGDPFKLDPEFDASAKQGKLLLPETNTDLQRFKDGFVNGFSKLDAKHSYNDLVKIDAGNLAVAVHTSDDVARDCKLYKIVGLHEYIFGKLQEPQQKRGLPEEPEDVPLKRPRSG